MAGHRERFALSACHPERSEGTLTISGRQGGGNGQRCFAALNMTSSEDEKSNVAATEESLRPQRVDWIHEAGPARRQITGDEGNRSQRNDGAEQRHRIERADAV